jgi:(E)-4-hydroxy-3-methylbut-2-enyl-diphosphate synthase
MQRRKSRSVKVGNMYIGGGAPISVQSMLNASSDNIDASVRQAIELENAGCGIIRTAVPI